MKSTPLSLLAILLLLWSGASPVVAAGTLPIAVREKWALIIAIGQFQDSAIKPLNYSTASARDLARVFDNPDSGHFTPGHVHLLLDGRATRYGIEHAATDDWLFRKALPNDLIVVYIATRMLEAGEHHLWYLCAADSIAADIETTGIPLEAFLRNLRNRTQSRRIICVLDTAPQAKSGYSEHSAGSGESWSELASRSGVSILYAGEAAPAGSSTFAAAESPLIHFLCESIKSTQGGASLHASSQYISRNLEEDSRKQKGLPAPKTVMYLAPDNELLSAIPLGLPIKNNSPIEQLHFGHPVDTLALDRPDLDQMINTHNTENTNDEGSGESFSQIDFEAYLNRMKKCIQTKWQPPSGFEDRSVATTFTIAKDGTIAEASVITSSGSDAVDSSALAALKAASPLEPLPPGSPNSVRIRYKFNWHVKPAAK